jgi:hypothetical protein
MHRVGCANHAEKVEVNSLDKREKLLRLPSLKWQGLKDGTEQDRSAGIPKNNASFVRGILTNFYVDRLKR